MLNCVQAASLDELAKARELFLEYAATPGFGVCFKGFDEEVQGLPSDYAPPEGRLLLAYIDGQAAGCVALRKMESGVCEIRRLYVRPVFRGQRLGRGLTEAIIAQAREAGYHTARLGTLPVMREAIALYQSLGFVRVAPYKADALDHAVYMQMTLS